MKKHPQVSIIIPVYKVPERFLRQCIESCINQTMQDIEIIIVDDGSPDDCGNICDEYATKDDRIKVIHKLNGGLVSARNAGFDAMTGEWHMYLDGDDWIDKDTCKNIFERTKKYDDIDIVFWKCVQELDDRSIKGKWEWSCTEAEHLYYGEDCKELARNVLIYKSGIATAYCKLIRTSYAEEHNIRHDDRLKQGAEGMEFSLRAFYYAKKALFINEYLYHYLFNPNSISKKIDEKNALYIANCLQVIEHEIELFERKNEFREALYQRTIYILLALAMNTYFHPDNKESFCSRSTKYYHLINNYPLYKQSIKQASTIGMDKYRLLAFYMVKLKLYFILDAISKIKYSLLRRGKYNY